MKKDKDFKIQKFLDQKMRRSEKTTFGVSNTDDLKAYELIYNHLKEKPDQGLPLSFKSNILRRIETEKKHADDTRFYLFLIFIFLVSIISITSLFLVLESTFSSLLYVISQSKGLIIIGVVAIVSFNYLEKRLNKTKL